MKGSKLEPLEPPSLRQGLGASLLYLSAVVTQIIRRTPIFRFRTFPTIQKKNL